MWVAPFDLVILKVACKLEKVPFLPLFTIYTCRVNDFRQMSYQVGLAVMNRSRTRQSDTNKIPSDSASWHISTDTVQNTDSVIPLLQQQNSLVNTLISEVCRVKGGVL